MKKQILMVCAVCAGAGFAGEERKPEWEDPAVNSINRLPARTYAMPLADERAALTDAFEPETPYRKSLNGTWKISWAGNPALRVKDFWKDGYDDSDWLTIDVPSCVETRGFGSPGYTNVRYPHANLSHPTNAAFASIRNRDTGKPDYNPVSSYRTTFTVPADWKGRDVILRFDGVYSAYYVWVNGKFVGYAEDSKLPSEFDVTPYLKQTTNYQLPSTNSLAVEVYRWCDGSYLEDQDMFRYSGIFRDVTLWAKPKDGIWDFAVKTTPVDGYAKWKLEVEEVKSKSEKVKSAELEISLYDAEHKKVGDLHCSTSTSDFDLIVDAPRLWSAETPYLYTLVIRKGEDIRMKRVGFKEQKVVGHTFLVNGRKVKFKGVNRHECNVDNGRTVSLEDMLRDITLFKRYNINTVRTSHYPNHHLWYDLCDRYGVYVVAEANVEGHEPDFKNDGLGLFPAWDHAIVERNARQVAFYRNNPSVTMWSMGNETGHGDCFRHAIAAVKKLDSSRPVHWERGNEDADLDAGMYPTYEWLEKRGQEGDAESGRCFFLSEYAHAMGNAVGNFQEYWDAFYNHDSLCGGCIWDWVDQAIWKETDRVDPATGRRERFLAYGGDWDEEPNDGPFCVNGLVDPFRNVSAKLVEVAHVHRNLVVTKPAGAGAADFELWNRFCFTKADAFAGVWKLRENGKVTKSGAFEVPAVAPLQRGRLTVPDLAAALAASAPGAELFVDFEFRTTKDEPWAKKGWIVARDQVAVGNGKWKFVSSGSGKDSASPLKALEDGRTVTVEQGTTKAVFCRETGTLCELVMNGKTILKDAVPGLASGPQFTCMRAFTDNDRWARDGDSWFENRVFGSLYSRGLSQLRYHARPIKVAGNVVTVVTEITGSMSAGFTHKAVWTFGADGAISVDNTVTPYGTMPPALTRMGLSLRLDKSLEQMAYYGRGPRENYVDRKTGSFLGLWESTVTDQFEPYVRPQDNGSKCDVRWVSFADKDGRGVRFAASEPMYVEALHYSADDLEHARHRAGQKRFRTPLVKRDEVYLNLDVRQLGLGGGSCGPTVVTKYGFPIEETAWTLRIEPLCPQPADVSSVFKKARPVWFADTSALAKANTAELATWLWLDERPTFVRVASDRPVRFNFDWKLVGWIPGDGRAHDFPILSGKGAHCLSLEAAAAATFVCAEAYRADGTVIACTAAADGGEEKPIASCLMKDSKPVPLKNVARDGFTRADAFACQPSLVAFKSSTGKHWLYQLEPGNPVVFTATEKVRGLPTAGIYCNDPGALVVKWGEKPSEQVRIVCEKEGEAGFKVVDPVVFDRMTFTVEKGQFEVNGVGATTLTDLDLALSSLTTSDAKINAAFTAAKRANDRAKAFDLIKKALGITKLDRQGKVLAFDPTVKNGLSFCGAKIGVGVDADEVIDFRWMREGTEGMATDSGKLPAGWRVIRDFDMQAECQRLVDEAIADGLQGGVQFCAYKDGKCIVNVCGGKLSKGGLAVRTDSLFPIFSTEKPLLSTACHRAVERGLMDYDKPLCTWWPELKGDGKEKLTLRETLGYRTCMPGGSPGQKGNPVCDHPMSDRELCDWEKVCKTAAADKPYGVPGTTQAYLPYAFAWMVGHPLEVAMKKPLKQVLDEEVLIPAGIEKDFYFVVPREEYPRVAKFYYGAFCEVMNEDWARQALMPSAWAVSSAEALCKFYNRLCGYDGKTPLIRKETLDAALKPCRHPSDPLPNAKSMKRDWFMLFGMGYGLWGSAERMDRVFGHGGAGGSEALVDRDNKLIVGYTCNYCKNCIAIRDKLYEVVGMRWRYWNDNVNIQDLQMTTSAGGTFGAGITSHQ